MPCCLWRFPTKNQSKSTSRELAATSTLSFSLQNEPNLFPAGISDVLQIFAVGVAAGPLVYDFFMGFLHLLYASAASIVKVAVEQRASPGAADQGIRRSLKM
jgi:hypothetical protein